MNAQIDVKLRYARHRTWQSGTLTDADANCASCGGVAVLIGDNAYPPREVRQIRIFSDCPTDLFDAAVEAGYFVLGQPAAKGGAA